MRGLRTGLGFRVAMMIAVLAAFCLVAPPAVMAFGHGSNTMHCLANADAVNHGMHGGGTQDTTATTGNCRATTLQAAAGFIA